MKKLTWITRLFVIVFVLSSASASLAASPERTLPATSGTDKTVHSLTAQGDYYARRGQLALALEHYSRSIRVGKLSDPNYEDLATQHKIVAIIQEQYAQETALTIKQLIWQGDDCATAQPERALEYYSQSIRVGKLHHDGYQDAETQEKIVALVKVLGSKLP